MARSTRHRRTPEDTTSRQSGSLLSHVFSFVSKEFESFVLNATARPLSHIVSELDADSSTNRQANLSRPSTSKSQEGAVAEIRKET